LTVRYFDSSAILSGLLEEKGRPQLRGLWDGADERLSSSLLKIECIIAIRRAALLQSVALDVAWADKRLELLSPFMDALNFKAVDGSIEEIIRLTPALADCRTLDAIHVATALHFKPNVESPLEIVTLDKRMRQLALRVGFQVQPSE